MEVEVEEVAAAAPAGPVRIGFRTTDAARAALVAHFQALAQQQRLRAAVFTCAVRSGPFRERSLLLWRKPCATRAL